MDDLTLSLSGNRNKAVPARISSQNPATDLAGSEQERRQGVSQAPSGSGHESDESTFLELRRKVQSGELLSAATERLLRKMKFNGHLTVVVQHGRLIKSGYEEGYFRRRNDFGGVLLDS